MITGLRMMQVELRCMVTESSERGSGAARIRRLYHPFECGLMVALERETSYYGYIGGSLRAKRTYSSASPTQSISRLRQEPRLLTASKLLIRDLATR